MLRKSVFFVMYHHRSVCFLAFGQLVSWQRFPLTPGFYCSSEERGGGMEGLKYREREKKKKGTKKEKGKK